MLMLSTANVKIYFLGSEIKNPYFIMFSKFGIEATSCAYFAFKLLLFYLVSSSMAVWSDISFIIIVIVINHILVVKSLDLANQYLSSINIIYIQYLTKALIIFNLRVNIFELGDLFSRLIQFIKFFK